MTDALKTTYVPEHTLVKVYDDVTGRWYGAWVPNQPPQNLWDLFRYWFSEPVSSTSEREVDWQLERRARRFWRKYRKRQIKEARRIARAKDREDAVN